MSFVRGAVAAMAMTGMRSLTVGLGLVRLTPPEEIASHGAEALLARVPPERRGAALEVAHWVYGGTGGVLFSALPARGRVAGVAYGLGAWAFFEAVVAPALGSTRRERTAAERLALATDHVLYGLILSE